MRSLVLLSFGMLLVLEIQGKSVWKQSYYRRYNHHTYQRFAPFSEEIDDCNFDAGLLNAAIFFETNKIRELHGSNLLKYHPLLELSSQGHSDDMVALNFFLHESPIEGKFSPIDRVWSVGLPIYDVGENLYLRYILDCDSIGYCPQSVCGQIRMNKTTDEAVKKLSYSAYAEIAVTRLMTSPGHKRNLLHLRFTHLGVGSTLFYEGEGIDFYPYAMCAQNFYRMPTFKEVYSRTKTRMLRRFFPNQLNSKSK